MLEPSSTIDESNSVMPNKHIRITSHARFEMTRRRIRLSLVLATIRNPGQVLPSRKGRLIYQSKIGRLGQLLLRVVVKKEKDIYHVITAYKSTRVAKYWKQL